MSLARNFFGFNTNLNCFRSPKKDGYARKNQKFPHCKSDRWGDNVDSLFQDVFFVRDRLWHDAEQCSDVVVLTPQKIETPIKASYLRFRRKIDEAVLSMIILPQSIHGAVRVPCRLRTPAGALMTRTPTRTCRHSRRNSVPEFLEFNNSMKMVCVCPKHVIFKRAIIDRLCNEIYNILSSFKI